MAAKDMAAKAFFGRPDIVADLCNCIIFRGKQLVRPEDVSDLPTELIEGPQNEDNQATQPDSVRICDSLKRVSFLSKGRKEDFVLNSEYQSTGSPNAIFRQKDYAGRGYTRMLTPWARKLKITIIPIISWTISLICRPWTYPCSLKRRFKHVDRRLLKYLNFIMNLIDPFTLDEKIINRMCPELKFVINCFRYSRDRKMLLKILTSIPDGVLSREAVYLLNTFLHLGLKYPENEEKISMCKAVDDLKRMWHNEGRRAGLKQGKAEGIAEGIEKGEEKIILSMLRRKATPQQVHQLTGVSMKRIIALATANLSPVPEAVVTTP